MEELNLTNFEIELTEVLESYDEALKMISTGKPTYDQLSTVEVNAYGGTQMVLSSLATFIFETPMSVVINFFDTSVRNDIKVALEDAKIGASIQDNGNNFRLTFRALTEEDKKEKVKLLGDLTESFRVRMRLLRQEQNSKIKSNEALREDDSKSLLEKVQKLLDQYIEKLDHAQEAKKSQIII